MLSLPYFDKFTAMQNPESLQPSETEELNQLQNYNKQYINNEMAAETGNIQQTAFFFPNLRRRILKSKVNEVHTLSLT